MLRASGVCVGIGVGKGAGVLTTVPLNIERISASAISFGDAAVAWAAIVLADDVVTDKAANGGAGSSEPNNALIRLTNAKVGGAAMTEAAVVADSSAARIPI